MLLNQARLPARFDPQGRIITLDRQDRGLWDTREVAEGERVLQSALAVQHPGRYQIEAAIAALHDDAASAAETDWLQVHPRLVRGLVALTDDAVRQDRAAVLARAVARGRGRARARCRRAARDRCARCSVTGTGGTPSAATCTSSAAIWLLPPLCMRTPGRLVTDVAERDHLVRQAARARDGRPALHSDRRTGSQEHAWRDHARDGCLVGPERSSVGASARAVPSWAGSSRDTSAPATRTPAVTANARS